MQLLIVLGAVIAFATTIRLAFQKRGATIVSAIATFCVAMIALFYMPQLETLKVPGAELRLKQTISVADEQVRRLSLLSANVAYRVLAQAITSGSSRGARTQLDRVDSDLSDQRLSKGQLFELRQPFFAALRLRVQAHISTVLQYFATQPVDKKWEETPDRSSAPYRVIYMGQVTIIPSAVDLAAVRKLALPPQVLPPTVAERVRAFVETTIGEYEDSRRDGRMTDALVMMLDQTDAQKSATAHRIWTGD